MNTSIPLCIDLDGTLLNSDLLLEAAFAQLKQTPLAVLHWPRWLAGGKATLKAEIAARVDLDIDTQLDEFADHSYDIVVLSQTLQATRHPAQILAQIERIAGLGVVSVPNFAHWRNRLSLAVTGRMPVSQALPYRWQDTPNIHLSSLRDLEHLFADLQLQVLNRVTLDPEGHQVKGALRGGPANLLAAGAAYLVATSSPVGNAGQG